MRLLLIHPPLTPEGPVQPPVGLAALAAWAVELGHETKVLDLDLVARQRPEGWLGCLEEFDRELEGFVPEVVGVTSMYSNSLHATALIGRTKRFQPQVITVAGGSHFGALPREALERDPNLDFVVQGEGEEPIAEFLLQCGTGRDWSKVPAFGWRDGLRVILNRPGPLMDMAQAPNPWRTSTKILDVSAYLSTIPADAPHKIAYVEAGRGCPYSCSFCATAPFWRRHYRVKSPTQIVREICSLHTAGYDRIVLVHDLLTANTRFVGELCDALMESRLPVQWMANSRTDISLDGLLPRMKAAGCWKLFFGLESASPKVQSAIRKNLALSDGFDAVAELARHGMTSTCSFVIGFPNESAQETSQSVGAGARLKMLGAETVQFHRLRLWPPAPLASLAENRVFDEMSVGIEHPFLEVSDQEIEQLATDPDFFGGYFPPKSSLGEPGQISQLEMFSHHSVAMAPMTIYLLEAFCSGQLVSTFYRVTEELGPIRRSTLDWDGGRLLQNWRVLYPYLFWITRNVGLVTWQVDVVTAVLSYEYQRLEFTSASATSKERELEFQCEVDIPRVIAAIGHGRDISQDFLCTTTIRFRASANGFECFAGCNMCGPAQLNE